jgi:hypothetical protein
MRRAVLISLTYAVCLVASHLGFAQDEPVPTRKVLSRLQPQYPALAQSSHVTGAVKLLVKVNANGKAIPSGW